MSSSRLRCAYDATNVGSMSARAHAPAAIQRTTRVVRPDRAGQAAPETERAAGPYTNQKLSASSTKDPSIR